MADDIARLGYEIDSTQARTAAGDLDRMSVAAGKAAGTADKLKISNNGLSTTYNAVNMSAKQLATTNLLVQKHFASTGNAAKKMGNQVAASNRHILNMGFQFQDIGMMMASGQNPLILAMQQGTQVSGIFNQMRMEGQGAFSAIKGGLLQLINPMSLMTIGAIAGGAALFQWGMSAMAASEDADELEKKLKSVRDAQVALNEEIRGFRLGVSSEELTLMDAIAAKNEEVVELKRRASLGNVEGNRNAARALQIGQQELGVLEDQLSTIKQSQTEKARMISATRDLANAEREVWAVTQDVSKEAEALTKELGYAAVKALVLAGVDITSPISSAASAAAVLAANLGISLNAALSLQNLQSSMQYSGRGSDPRKFGDPTDRDPSGGTGTLSPDAQSLIDRANERSKKKGGGGKSAAEKLQDDMQKRYEVLSEGFKSESALAMSNYAKDLETLKWALEQKRLTQSEYKVAQDTLRIETWGSEFEQQQLQYQLEQDALAAALEKKYITEKDYQQRIAAIKTAERNVTLMQTAGLFGSLQQMAQAGGAKLAKTAAIFGGIQATIASYVAATKAMAETPGSMFTRIAAYASVLATGLGAVAAIKSAGGGGSGGGVSSAPSSAAGTTQQAQPERRVRLSIDSDDWVRAFIEPMMKQIYEQTGDGTKVIFSK